MKVHLRESMEELHRKIHLKAYAPIKDRLRSVLWAAQQKSARAIAELLGYAQTSIERWVGRYHQEGEAGLWDQPRAGQKKKLTLAQEEQVRVWIEQGPTVEEGRSRYRVQDLQKKIQEELGVHFSWSGVRYLVVVRFGYRLLRARPVHEKNDQATMEIWTREAPFLSSRSKRSTPSKKSKFSFKTKRDLGKKAGSLRCGQSGEVVLSGFAPQDFFVLISSERSIPSLDSAWD